MLIFALVLFVYTVLLLFAPSSRITKGVTQLRLDFKFIKSFISPDTFWHGKQSISDSTIAVKT